MNKIDLIIDALEQYVNVVVSHNDPNNFRVRVKDGGEPARKALAAARELKALKPVAWMLPEYGDVLSASEADGTGIYNVPLYALDEVTK